MLMVLAPAASAIFADAVPDVTATPFTAIAALASVPVGITVMPVVAFVTLAV